MKTIDIFVYFSQQALKILKTTPICRRTVPVSYTHLDVYKRQTQDCRHEQMTDENTGPILTAKEEGRHPDWQVTYHGSEVLKGYWAQWESLTLSLIHI